MILVRDIFNLKFGKAKEAISVWNEGKKILQNVNHFPERVLTDFTGNYYTLVIESTFNSLSEFEESLQNAFKAKDYQEWYQKFIPLAEGGHREIFKILV
jgi:hypothetical protein